MTDCKAATKPTPSLVDPGPDLPRVRAWLAEHGVGPLLNRCDVLRALGIENPTHTDFARVGAVLRALGWSPLSRSDLFVRTSESSTAPPSPAARKRPTRPRKAATEREPHADLARDLPVAVAEAGPPLPPAGLPIFDWIPISEIEVPPGWPIHRVRRHLLKLEKLHGGILRKVVDSRSGRWFVNTHAVHVLARQWRGSQ